jgi:DnaJ family protein C protein 9
MTKLYTLLGVAKTADSSEIARAYRRLALQYHPDRNPDGADMFKELAKAYEVLNDIERRAVYDATGIVPGDEDDTKNDAERMQQRSAELGEDIRQFYATYRDSPEEVADLTAAYTKAKGDFEAILFEHALYDNVKGEVARIHGILSTLVADGALVATNKWNKTSTPAAVKSYQKELAQERKEAQTMKAKLGLSRGRGAGGEGDAPPSLQVMLANRSKAQAADWENMTNGLMAKYGGAATGAGKKKPKKGSA